MSSRRRVSVCPSGRSSSRPLGTPLWMLVIRPVMIFFSSAGSWGSVGICQVLVEAPGDLERGMPFVSERLREPVLLPGGRQPCSGAGDAADAVERVTGASPMPQGLAVDALPTVVQLLCDQGHHMDGIHDRDHGCRPLRVLRFCNR